MNAVMQSLITCRVCNHARKETMPEGSCQFFYECERCKTVLKLQEGDCCMCCQYGSVPCLLNSQAKKVVAEFFKYHINKFPDALT
jgi:hypothetical protein